MATRLTALVAAGTAAAVAVASGCGQAARAEGDANCPSPRLTAAGHRFSVYWLGSTFHNLPITNCEQQSAGRPRPGSSGMAVSLIYGDCTPEPPSESCSPPLEVQETSVCAVGPLTYDIRSTGRSVSRGALLARYGNGLTDVYTGSTNVRITDYGAISMKNKVAALRPVGRALSHGRLPMPRFPRSTIRTLRRVRSLYRQLGSTRRVRSRLHISRTAVRDRLDLLRDIERLARTRHTGVRTIDC
jgi:hypothetical protein